MVTIEYIKYAVEIAKTKSINKASENLYISQPNLSRTIVKLEEELGFKIFIRSKQGIELTMEGKEFLYYAESMLEEYDHICAINTPDRFIHSFSISVPKAAYITNAITGFVNSISSLPKFTIDFKECNALGAVENIVSKGFNLGIIRYERQFEPVFQTFLNDLGIVSREICSFDFLVAFSKYDPLANKKEIVYSDLANYVEISHGDNYLPYGNAHTIGSDVLPQERVLRVYDSMGQLSMVQNIPNSFMIVSPLAIETMEKYNLVQRKVEGISKSACDVLIYKKNYQLSWLDQKFIEELQKQII